MRTEIAATMINGVPTPDVPLPVPDQTPVRLVVETVEPKREPIAAWKALEERLRLRPVHGGGKRLNRDELYGRQ
jgi:hypothetical protein